MWARHKLSSRVQHSLSDPIPRLQQLSSIVRPSISVQEGLDLSSQLLHFLREDQNQPSRASLLQKVLLSQRVRQRSSSITALLTRLEREQRQQRAVINRQTVSFGSEGVGLASTTIVIPPNAQSPPFSAVTAGDFTLSVNPTEAVIGGMTYPIGSAAKSPPLL